MNRKIMPFHGNIEDFKEDVDIQVEVPLFIIFAEYLGYCSRFTKLAEKWVDGDVPDVHIQKIMQLECLAIKRSMEKDYTRDEVRKWFETYYEPILKEINTRLENLFS